MDEEQINTPLAHVGQRPRVEGKEGESWTGVTSHEAAVSPAAAGRVGLTALSGGREDLVWPSARTWPDPLRPSAACRRRWASTVPWHARYFEPGRRAGNAVGGDRQAGVRLMLAVVRVRAGLGQAEYSTVQ